MVFDVLLSLKKGAVCWSVETLDDSALDLKANSGGLGHDALATTTGACAHHAKKRLFPVESRRYLMGHAPVSEMSYEDCSAMHKILWLFP